MIASILLGHPFPFGYLLSFLIDESRPVEQIGHWSHRLSSKAGARFKFTTTSHKHSINDTVALFGAIFSKNSSIRIIFATQTPTWAVRDARHTCNLCTLHRYLDPRTEYEQDPTLNTTPGPVSGRQRTQCMRYRQAMSDSGRRQLTNR